MTKYILTFIGAVLLGGALYGAYLYPQASQLVGSSAGTTFSTAKIATVVMSPSAAGANATTSSILNTDASDRKIETFVADCSGVGTSQAVNTGGGLASAGFIVSAATTSTSVPTVVTNTNALTLPISTSTPDSYNIVGNATTTVALNRVWASGSYLTFQFNATNTASCIIGVNYLAS